MSSEQLKAKIIALAPLLITAVALINSVLTLKGLPAIEIGNEVITSVINGLADIICVIWCWWKNNNFTRDAQIAQPVLNGLKDGTITEGQVEDLINE